MLSTWLIILLGAAPGAAPADKSEPAAHCLVIGIDGLWAPALVQTTLPNLRALMMTGATLERLESVLPTKSRPNWASILMAVEPSDHGFVRNWWRWPRLTTFPTLFAALRAREPKASTAALYDWDDMATILESDALSHQELTANDAITVSRAITVLEASRPRLMFVYLESVDMAGHDHGWGSASYNRALEQADRWVGELVDAMRRIDILSKSLIVVVSDHGGLDKEHGGNTPAERITPFIISGPGVKRGAVLAGPSSVIDVAPTVALLMTIPAPTVWRGKPICGLLERRSSGPCAAAMMGEPEAVPVAR